MRLSFLSSESLHYNDDLWIYAQRLSNNNEPEFCDTEILSIYLWGTMRGYKKIKTIYDYTKDHLMEWFPKLPAYPSCVQRLNRLNGVFIPLLSKIQQDFPILELLEPIALIDSMPIMIAKAQRSGSAKAAGEIANKGYNSTKKTYYYGVKLHVLGIRRPGHLPIPDYIGLTKASEADINVLKEIAEHIYDTKIYADKAYISELLASSLAQQASELHTP